MDIISLCKTAEHGMPSISHDLILRATQITNIVLEVNMKYVLAHYIKTLKYAFVIDIWWTWFVSACTSYVLTKELQQFNTFLSSCYHCSFIGIGMNSSWQFVSSKKAIYHDNSSIKLKNIFPLNHLPNRKHYPY